MDARERARNGHWKLEIRILGLRILNIEFQISNVLSLRPPELQPWNPTASAERVPMLNSGDQSAVEPPGPIPNPEVKRRSANGSETIGLVRVGRRQVYARLQAIGAGLFFCLTNKLIFL